MVSDLYESVGPFLVSYEWADGHIEMWSVETLSLAVCMFWQDHRLSQPERRHISDANGVTIQSEHHRPPTVYAFQATREVRRRTKTLSHDSPHQDEFLAIMEAHPCPMT